MNPVQPKLVARPQQDVEVEAEAMLDPRPALGPSASLVTGLLLGSWPLQKPGVTAPVGAHLGV